MALPPDPGRLILLWILIGLIIGVAVYAAFESLWAAIPSGVVIGFFVAGRIEIWRRTRVGPHRGDGPGPECP